MDELSIPFGQITVLEFLGFSADRCDRNAGLSRISCAGFLCLLWLTCNVRISTTCCDSQHRVQKILRFFVTPNRNSGVSTILVTRQIVDVRHS